MNIEEIIQEHAAAPYGSKDAVVERWANLYGVAKQTIYRKMQQVNGKTRQRKAAPKISDKQIEVVAQLKALSGSYGRKKRYLATEDAIEIAESKGLIQPGTLNRSTVDMRLRKAGFHDAKPVQRYLEAFCNQAHYVDFSRSEYIAVRGYDSAAGEYLLKLSKLPLRYKNKQGESFGLWAAGLRDGRSGIRHVRYYTVTAENSYMGLDFLSWCWTRPADGHPLNSVPYFLRSDNGPLKENKDIGSMLEALEIELRPSTPENKQAMGKIERPWRTWWQRFELKLVMERGIGWTFYVNDLNELAFEHTLKELDREHPLIPGKTKREVYLQDIEGYYPPRVFEGDIRDFASRHKRCKVGRDLKFRFQNQWFAAPERYMDKWVLVHYNRNGDVIAEGEHDGVRFELAGWQPQEWDDYRAFPDTYQERMLKEAQWNFEMQGDGKTVKMKREPERIDPKSVHVRPGGQVFTYDKAREYIAAQLNLDNYNEVAHLFDELLETRLDKAAIDEVIQIMKKEVG